MLIYFSGQLRALTLLGVFLTALPLCAQKTWTLPRTPDGKPDLQGIWNNATLTPLERPAQYAGKSTLNEKRQQHSKRKS